MKNFQQRMVRPVLTLPTHRSSFFFEGAVLVNDRSPLHLNRLYMKDSDKTKDHLLNELIKFRNITEQYDELLLRYNKLKEEKEKKEKELKAVNDSKDRFFSIISHDLRNPFVPLLGYADLLVENYSDFTEEERFSFMQEIQHSSKSILILLDNLMQWSRSQRGILEIKQQDIDLKSLVKEIINSQSLSIKNKKLNVINDIPGDLNVKADRNTLSTVIRNLLANAVKFTPNEGTISFFVNDTGSFYEVHVKDTGIGIKPENLKKLFNMDTNYTTLGTAEEEGTGLGLILCHEFIEANGGSIRIESDLGKGSDFIFTIPR